MSQELDVAARQLMERTIEIVNRELGSKAFMDWDRIPEEVRDLWREKIHRPSRGSDVEAWLKAERDKLDRTSGVQRALWFYVDSLLDSYRLRADTGLYLHQDISEATGC